MKSLPKRFLAVVLTLALGLGVWTIAAVSFQQSDFEGGDILSADELNNLLNDNFDAAADAINENADDITALDGRVTGNEADISDLQADKVDRDGDTITGRLNIEGDAARMLSVENTDDGRAAFFEGSFDETDGTGLVTIKQNGAAPALSLKANGGGPLLAGAGAGQVTFLVADDGSISIGELGIDGTDEPTIHLDAGEGTITNDIGSGLPLAFGGVASDGTILSGTDNFSVSTETTTAGPRYRIDIDGESYHLNAYATAVTAIGGVSASSSSQGDDLIVHVHDEDGDRIQGQFHFVTYKPGN